MGILNKLSSIFTCIKVASNKPTSKPIYVAHTPVCGFININDYKIILCSNRKICYDIYSKLMDRNDDGLPIWADFTWNYYGLVIEHPESVKLRRIILEKYPTYEDIEIDLSNSPIDSDRVAVARHTYNENVLKKLLYDDCQQVIYEAVYKLLKINRFKELSKDPGIANIISKHAILIDKVHQDYLNYILLFD